MDGRFAVLRSEVAGLFDEVARDRKTVDDVVLLLRDEGVRGYKKSACMCPIARFVLVRTGICVAVVPVETRRDGDGFARVRRVEHSDDFDDEVVPLPRVLAEFARQFDGGRHGEFELQGAGVP